MFDDTGLRDLSQPFRWEIPDYETPWEYEEQPAVETESADSVDDWAPAGRTTLRREEERQQVEFGRAPGRLDLPDVVRVFKIPHDKITVDSQYGNLAPVDLDEHDYYLAVVQPAVMFGDGERLVRLGLSLYLYPEGTTAIALLPENQKQSTEIMSGKFGFDLGAAASACLATAGIKLPDDLISAEVEFPFKWTSNKTMVRVAGVQTRKAQWEIADEDIAGAFAANAFLCAHKGTEVVICATLDGRKRRWFNLDDLPGTRRFYRLSDGHVDPNFDPWAAGASA